MGNNPRQSSGSPGGSADRTTLPKDPVSGEKGPENTEETISETSRPPETFRPLATLPDAYDNEFDIDEPHPQEVMMKGILRHLLDREMRRDLVNGRRSRAKISEDYIHALGMETVTEEEQRLETERVATMKQAQLAVQKTERGED